MKRISKEHHIIVMSPRHNAVAQAESGSTVVFETYDCFTNQITSEEQTSSSVDRSKINPATGPLYVEGAEPGDTLKVEILDIHIADQGVMAISPLRGALAGTIKEEKTKLIPIVNGEAVFNDTLRLTINPMIGVIGTAPKEDDIPTSTPGTHGGNMDCKRIVKGSTLYLPVNVAGGLLAMGDVHAVMGDGEIVICGLEIPAEVKVRITVLKGHELPLPMLVDKDHVMTIASADTLDEASEKAIKQMHTFLAEVVKMDFHEAAMFLSVGADLKVCQIVNPQKTARMELPIWVLESHGYELN